MKIEFYDFETVENNVLKYAIIVAKYQDKWIFVRHKERTTWEIPGGRREKAENIADTAARELKEETGAMKFQIQKVCVYSVEKTNAKVMEVSSMQRLKNLENFLTWRLLKSRCQILFLRI